MFDRFLIIITFFQNFLMTFSEGEKEADFPSFLKKTGEFL